MSKNESSKHTNQSIQTDVPEVGLSSRGRAFNSRCLLAALFVLPAVALFQSEPAHAQVVACPDVGQALLPIPEIARDANAKILRGGITVGDEMRRVWFNDPTLGLYCADQRIRYLKNTAIPGPVSPEDPTATMPGPTLRARVGDIVQLTLLNQIDDEWFANSRDTGEDGCDEVRTIDPEHYPDGEVYPGATGDKMPNCFHGSSTMNLHFHGTHTSPSTTGDNVLIQVRPTPKTGSQPTVTEATFKQDFDQFFEQCRLNLQGSARPPTSWPIRWEQLPQHYRSAQEALLVNYDANAQYRGGRGLPPGDQLWPKNEKSIDAGDWPNYYVGAYPYCFELPEYLSADFPPSSGDDLQMGQAPGTHWYHAHKHGSTHLNISNGMTGVMIIEGDYDDTLRAHYQSQPDGLKEKVIVIQQIGMSPNVMRAFRFDADGNRQFPGSDQLSVNGRRQPYISMRPGETQLWRIVNNAARSGVYFAAPTDGVQWQQTAQDGVQFAPSNFVAQDNENAAFLLAGANRADLLVRAPMTPGAVIEIKYEDTVTRALGDATSVLMTIKIEGDPVAAELDFPSEAEFPKLPAFLADIEAQPYARTRELTFESNRNAAGIASHTINGGKFSNQVSQAMVLNTVEEWKLINTTGNIAHPFHIHINPYQVVELFEPTVCDGIDPTNPDTWTPCQELTAPYVWWDNFAIPNSKAEPLDSNVCTQLDNCPEAIRKFTSCADGTCTVTIPGYFKMRSRFTDYTGQFVLHCHILAHEDRGMMQLIEVISDQPRGTHN